MTPEPTTRMAIQVDMEVADWIAMRIVHICDHLGMTFEQFAHLAIVELAARHPEL